MFTDEEMKETLSSLSSQDLTGSLAYNILKLSKKQREGIQFVSMLIFGIETNLKEHILATIRSGVSDGKIVDVVNGILDEITLFQKIDVVKKMIPDIKKDYPNLLCFCDAMNKVRNQVFHAKRITDIKYNEKHSVFDVETQRQMYFDYCNAFLSNQERALKGST